MSNATRPTTITNVLLWLLALVLMGGSAVYQRLTGPTHPLRATYAANGDDVKVRLVRSSDTTRPARVEIPAPVAGSEGTLLARRYPTEEPYVATPLVREGSILHGDLPLQPAAGKVEYRVELRHGEVVTRLPGPGEETVVLRYKDPVPAGALVPHIALMFLAVLVGLRTALAALFGHAGLGRLTFATLGLMTVGGLVLGPIVQKYAFGAYWTGWPFGHDLTDNKVLVMWTVWVAAGLGLALRRPSREGGRRVLVIAAAVVMMVVYLIPHSLRGSELDYDKLREGVAPEDAIRTGCLHPGRGPRRPA